MLFPWIECPDISLHLQGSYYSLTLSPKFFQVGFLQVLPLPWSLPTSPPSWEDSVILPRVQPLCHMHRPSAVYLSHNMVVVVLPDWKQMAWEGRSSALALSCQSSTALYHLLLDICPQSFYGQRQNHHRTHQHQSCVPILVRGTTSHSISQTSGIPSPQYFWTWIFTFSWSHPLPSPSPLPLPWCKPL